MTYYYLLYNRGAIPRFIMLFKVELLILTILLYYVFILDVLVYKGNVYLTHVMYYLFEVLPTSYFIVSVIFKKLSTDSIYRYLIYLGTIAASISIISAIFVPVNEFLMYVLKGNDVATMYHGRNYGFASGFLYSYPIGQGFIGVLCLIMIKTNKKYIISFILVLVSIAINARIGLMPIIIYLGYSVYKFNLKFLLYLLLFLVVFIFANNYGLFTPFQDIVDWNISMFHELSNQFFGTTFGKYGGGYTWFNWIYDHFLIFPNSFFHWIFGEQILVFYGIENHSDIGYINDLMYGGIFLVMLIGAFFIRIYWRLLKLKDNKSVVIAFIIIGTYLIANIKGEFFRPNSGNRVIILIFTYFIYNAKYVGHVLFENKNRNMLSYTSKHK